MLKIQQLFAGLFVWLFVAMPIFGFSIAMAEDGTNDTQLPEQIEPATSAKPFMVIVEVPIFSQKIRFNLPTDWVHTHTSQNEAAYLIEFTPKNENPKQWNNLFSIQGVKNFNPESSPEQVSDFIAQNLVKNCPDAAVYTKIGERNLSSHLAYLSLIGCSSVPADIDIGLTDGMSEIAYYAIIKGKNDLYIAHKSIRSESFEGDSFPAVIESAIEDMKAFFPIEFCALESPKGQCLE